MVYGGKYGKDNRYRKIFSGLCMSLLLGESLLPANATSLLNTPTIPPDFKKICHSCMPPVFYGSKLDQKKCEALKDFCWQPVKAIPIQVFPVKTCPFCEPKLKKPLPPGKPNPPEEPTLPIEKLTPPQKPIPPEEPTLPVEELTPPQKPIPPEEPTLPVEELTPPQRPIPPEEPTLPVEELTPPQRPIPPEEPTLPVEELTPPQKTYTTGRANTSC